MSDTVLGQRKLWTIALLVAVVFTVLGTPQAAWAHNALVSTSPGDGKTVTEPPSSIVLTFNEPAIATGTKVLVTGPDGSVAAGDPQLVDTTVEQTLLPELSAGEYTVEWRVTSADGHPINGEFSFTVRTGSVGKSTATPVPTTKDAESPSPSQTASASDQATTVATPSGGPVGSAAEPSIGLVVAAGGGADRIGRCPRLALQPAALNTAPRAVRGGHRPQVPALSVSRCSIRVSSLASSRATVARSSSSFELTVDTRSTNQDAKVAVTVPSRATPPTIRAAATQRPITVTG